MDTFKSIENMKACLSIFGRYMNDKFQIDIDSLLDSNPKVALFSIMNDISNTQQFVNLTVKELNNIAINKLRNFYVDKYNITESSKKLHVASLDREKQVHGSRTVNDIQFKPINTKAEVHENIDKDFDRLMASRTGEKSIVETQNPIDKPLTEKAMSKDEFQVRLTDFEKHRGDLLQASIDISKIHEKSDPKAFYESVLKKNNEKEKMSFNNQINQTNHSNTNGLDNVFAPTPEYEHHARKDLIPVSKYIESPLFYMAINGFDRDWDYYKSRFQFSMDFTNMTRTYKNVCEMSFTKLIIPSEILEERTLTNVPKTNYLHNFRFAYPYLLLMVDEFSDVYDGKTNANQRAFTHFIYEMHYNAPNGRGYIILNPAQHERKVFYPNPLASLQRLSLTIAKPNGTLFNKSQDNNFVWKVEYEEYNRMFLKIVLEKYFDKNEFFVGDIVLVRNFKIPVVLNTSSPEYTEYNSKRYIYDQIMAFINRQEGHEIIEIGKPNEEGFYRTFYIHAPSKMDTSLGKYVIETPIVDTIQSYNELSYACCMSPTPIGSIINTSLQFSLTMNLKMAIGDAVHALTPQIV
jgi:hypothetical protein